jgi:hypothetical protein
MVNLSVFLDGQKLGELQNGEEQTIEINAGTYEIEAKGLLMTGIKKTITVQENENKKLFVVIDIASKGKFHASTEGMFLMKAPISIYENYYEFPFNKDKRTIHPFFFSRIWGVILILISTVPIITEISGTTNSLNLLFLIGIPLIFSIQFYIFTKNRIAKRQLFFIELNMAVTYLFFSFVFTENIHFLTRIAIFASSGILIIMFVIKYLRSSKVKC